jgi:DNA uptake protein ComE-like DNA-binding protein
MVEWRAAHGPFGGLARLDSVPGIGPRLLETLRPYVEFSGRRP